MTILADSELLAGPFEGNGAVSQFTFNFRAFGSPEFVAVWVKEDAPRAEAELLSHGVDYSVTQQPNAHTGRVNLLPSGKYPTLPTGYLIAIAGVFPEFQGIPFRASERFFAVRHEFAYDYTVNLIKQLRRDIQRVFDIPDSPFEAPRIWINGVTLEEYIRMLADAEVERAFAPKTPVLVTGPELFLGLESHRVPYILLNECTVYVPEGMPPGWTCDFQRAGGPVTFATPEGMQWWSVDVAKTIQHQYAWANLTCIESNIMSLSGDVYGEGYEPDVSVVPGEFFASGGEWFYAPVDNDDLREKMELWDVPEFANDPHALVSFEDSKGVEREIPANNIYLGGFDRLDYVFDGMEHFNQYIGGWDVSSIEVFDHVFNNALEYNQPLDGWVTSSARRFNHTFARTPKFNQPLSHFLMDKVDRVIGMFKEAVAFNQPIGNWEFKELTHAWQMFEGATSFNQPLQNWNVKTAHPYEDWSPLRDRWGLMEMFKDAAAFDQDLSSWCVSQYTNSNPPIDFATGSGLSPEHYPVWGTCPGG